MCIKVEGYIGMFTSIMYLSLFLEPCRSCWYDSVPSPLLPPRPPHQWAPSHTMTQVRQVFTVWPLSTPFRYKILLSFHCHLCSHFILVNLRYMIYFIMNNFRKVFILFILFFFVFILTFLYLCEFPMFSKPFLLFISYKGRKKKGKMCSCWFMLM